MGLMNLNLGLLLYEDPQTAAPKIRTPDIERCYQNVSVSNPKSEEVTLYPGEMTTVAATSRALGIDATTEFLLTRPRANEDIIRLIHTGTGSAPNFRVKRNLAVDATTEVSFSRISPNTARLSHSSGTALDTSAVQVGDYLKFERSTSTFTSVFSDINVGHFFRVQAKGAGYIDFLDNGAADLQTGVVLGTDFDMQVRVLSPGPTRVGDTMEMTGSGVNIGNLGRFTISDLSSDYIEFINPFAVTQTFTNSSNVVVYDHLMGFLMVRCPGGTFKLKVNGQSEFNVGMIAGEGLFMGSVEAHTVEALNESADPIKVYILRTSIL